MLLFKCLLFLWIYKIITLRHMANITTIAPRPTMSTGRASSSTAGTPSTTLSGSKTLTTYKDPSTTTTTTPSLTSSSNQGAAFFGALPSNFVGVGKTYSSSSAQAFNLSQLPPTTQQAILSLPQAWLQSASQDQLSALVDAIHQYPQQMIANSTLNHPDSLYQDPTVNNFTDDMYATDDSGYTTVNPVYADDAPDRHHPDYLQQQNEQWNHSLDIKEFAAASRNFFKGLDLLDTVSTAVSSGEAASTLGESLIAAGEAAAGTLGFETGLAAGVAEALGGAAAVGGFIAGGELIAGAALIGLGAYEAYRAFGGQPNETIESLTSSVQTVFQSASQFQGQLNRFQDIGSVLSNSGTGTLNFLDQVQDSGSVMEGVETAFEGFASFFAP